MIQKLFQNFGYNGGRHLTLIWTTSFLTDSGSNSLGKVISDDTCVLCWTRFTADLCCGIGDDLVVIPLFPEHHLMVCNSCSDTVLELFSVKYNAWGRCVRWPRDC